MAFIGRVRHSVRAVVRESQGAGTGLPALPGPWRALPFVQRDAGAHPGLVDVEIDAHHFALAHSDEIID